MKRISAKYHNMGIAMLLAAVMVIQGCSSTKHLSEGQYLVRKVNIKLKTNTVVTNKGEMKDNLAHLVVQN